MRLHPALVITVLAIALALIPPAGAAATYNLAVNPSYPVTRGTTMTFSLNLTGGSRNTDYSVVIGVAKPNGTGEASAALTFRTDNQGVGRTTLSYPDPSFTAVNGTVATDVGGVYTVQVNQTAPFFQASVASAQFTVISKLTVVLTQPPTGSYVQRGQKLTITASVTDLGGPVTTATVSTNAPSSGRIFMQQIGNGIYSADYTVLMYDPPGPWTIIASASDPSGNSGSSNLVNLTVTRSDLVVDSLATFNSKGALTSDFAPGDVIYPFFRLRYSTGDLLTRGQYRVAVENPSGQEIANLTAVYDNTRLGFYTTTGYMISPSDPTGSWKIAVDAGSVNDGFGNTGPFYTTAVNIEVVTVTSSWGFLPFVIGGVAALASGALLFKRYDKSARGFEQLEQMMGGPMPRGSSILILGDPGSGKTILSYEFLHDELENGRYCAVLSYDAFPEDVQARMMEFGWDITSHLRKGRLKIVDCYSGLAGEGEGAIKDPSDLTELNIRVTSMIGHARGKPVTLVLDSLTPIFNGVDSKQAIAFIQTVGAKVKRTGGVFVSTGSTGAIASEALAKIKSFTDGVIELTLVRNHRKTTRFLSVLKMERRTISRETIPFEIERREGFVFHVSRVKGAFLRTHVTEELTGHALFQKPDSQRKPAPVDNAQRPETVTRFQDSKQDPEALPPWGRRDAPASQTLISQNEGRKSTAPRIFERLRDASNRVWGVPPSSDQVQPPELLQPLHLEQPPREEKPTSSLVKPEPQPTLQQPSTPPPTATKTSPAQASEPPRARSSSPSKPEIDKDYSKNKPKGRFKDPHDSEEAAQTTEPQSSTSTPPASDEAGRKTPAASST